MKDQGPTPGGEYRITGTIDHLSATTQHAPSSFATTATQSSGFRSSSSPPTSQQAIFNNCHPSRNSPTQVTKPPQGKAPHPEGSERDSAGTLPKPHASSPERLRLQQHTRAAREGEATEGPRGTGRTHCTANASAQRGVRGATPSHQLGTSGHGHTAPSSSFKQQGKCQAAPHRLAGLWETPQISKADLRGPHGRSAANRREGRSTARRPDHVKALNKQAAPTQRTWRAGQWGRRPRTAMAELRGPRWTVRMA